jgi:hypothetical protein
LFVKIGAPRVASPAGVGPTATEALTVPALGTPVTVAETWTAPFDEDPASRRNRTPPRSDERSGRLGLSIHTAVADAPGEGRGLEPVLWACSDAPDETMASVVVELDPHPYPPTAHARIIAVMQGLVDKALPSIFPLR